MQLTLLLLCSGKMSKVRTSWVRRAIPRAAILEPVKMPPVVMTAAPPAPARNPVVPPMPIVVKAAPKPAPMTGASSPAERPMTKPPPTHENCVRCDVDHSMAARTECRKTHYHVTLIPSCFLPTLNQLLVIRPFNAFLNFKRFCHPTLKFDHV